MNLRAAVRRCLPAAIAVAVLATPAFGRGEGTLDVFLGSKWLRVSDWQPVERQPEAGILLAFAQERAPVRFAIEILASHDSADTTDPISGPGRMTGSTIEYGVGIRKEWGRGLFRPRIASGGALVEARVERETQGSVFKRDRSGIGLWVAGGFAFRIARHFDLGLEIRYSKSTVELGRGFEQLQVEAGGLHAGLGVGFGW